MTGIPILKSSLLSEACDLAESFVVAMGLKVEVQILL